MKKISVLFSLVLLSSIVAFGQNDKKGLVEMQFEELDHDFGVLAYASDATHVFKFKNNSKQAIALTNVKSSCGCTSPSWSKEPIQPGQTGSVEVKYNTNLPGAFNKTIQVFSTAKNSPVRISVRGNVTPKTKADAAESANPVTGQNVQAKKAVVGNENSGKNTFPVTKGSTKKANMELIEKTNKKK